MPTIEDPSWHSICHFLKIDPDANYSTDQIAKFTLMYRAANNYDE